jgi:hypothetical protein
MSPKLAPDRVPRLPPLWLASFARVVCSVPCVIEVGGVQCPVLACMALSAAPINTRIGKGDEGLLPACHCAVMVDLVTLVCATPGLVASRQRMLSTYGTGRNASRRRPAAVDDPHLSVRSWICRLSAIDVVRGISCWSEIMPIGWWGRWR